MTSEIEAGDFGRYEQLIELQKQIVAVAEQNAETERRCAHLREQLEREVGARIEPRRAVHERLRDVASGMFGRLLKRSVGPSEPKRP